MTYFTDSNQIEDLMKQLADVEVRPLNTLDPWTGVDVYLFDKVVEPWARTPDCFFSPIIFLRHNPDWGGMILELMRKNENVYLFFGEWRRVVYSDWNQFSFVVCRPPIMDADRTCLIASRNLTYMMRKSIQDLMEPIRFGQSIANRILGESEEPHVKSLLTFTKGDYKEICLKMEQLMNDVMHQRDLWKDRFFFHGMNVDRKELCETCKEEMRKAFYVSGDEEVALKWRPSNSESECVSKNCKYFLWDTFEDEYPTSCNNDNDNDDELSD